MKLKISPGEILSTITIAIFVINFSLSFIFKKNTQNLSNSFTPSNLIIKNAEQINPILQPHLKIPAINVDTIVEPVGITYDGLMDVPKNQDNVAWFNLGPHLGDIGNAVIAGHYGWKKGRPAAFDNLHKLNKGDKLYFENGKGDVTIFVVREIKSYNAKADASDIFNGKDDKSHLNLITCEGIWDKVSKSYSKRLVVFTDKE